MSARANNIADKPLALAWCGWGMPIMPAWRPMKVQGEWKRGEIIVGDDAEAAFKITWWRPERSSFDGHAWIHNRIRELGNVPSDDSAAPRGFSSTAFVAEQPSRGGGLRGLWFGYSADIGLMLEVAVNRGASKTAQDFVLKNALPDLQISHYGEPVRWALYSAGFVSPPGYELSEWHLFSGDIALRLLNEKNAARITVRQVYPAALALKRRDMLRWMESFPFKEHRRYQRNGVAKHYSCEGFNGRLNGLLQSGSKRLAFPLQWCKPLQTVAAGVQDDMLERLLLAQLDTPETPPEMIVEKAIARMNWSSGGGSFPERWQAAA